MDLDAKAVDLSWCGTTLVWLALPTEYAAPQDTYDLKMIYFELKEYMEYYKSVNTFHGMTLGYMPSDLYNLNSTYKTNEELKYWI